MSSCISDVFDTGYGQTFDRPGDAARGVRDYCDLPPLFDPSNDDLLLDLSFAPAVQHTGQDKDTGRAATAPKDRKQQSRLIQKRYREKLKVRDLCKLGIPIWAASCNPYV